MSSSTDPIFLNEILRPNPPMKPGALRLILILVAGINFAFAIGFVLHGAWPIAPFMGADVGLLAWAFRTSRIAARTFEHIKLTASQLLVAHHSAQGQVRKTIMNPYWVSVQLEQPEDLPRKLTLRSHGRTLQIGSFLGPRERRSLALALKVALGAARSWRPA